MDDYLKCFKITLQLNCPMIIYTEEKVKKFIEAYRPKEYNTHIIIQNIDEIPYYRYRKQIDTILSDPLYKSKIKDPDRIECRLPEYTIIRYSKLEWLQDGIKKNPFSSDYFFWMDAGCSRFLENFDLRYQWPSENSYNLLKTNKIILKIK